MQCRCTLWLPCLVHRSGYSYIDKYKSTLPHENNMFYFVFILRKCLFFVFISEISPYSRTRPQRR